MYSLKPLNGGQVWGQPFFVLYQTMGKFILRLNLEMVAFLLSAVSASCELFWFPLVCRTHLRKGLGREVLSQLLVLLSATTQVKRRRRRKERGRGRRERSWETQGWNSRRRMTMMMK